MQAIQPVTTVTGDGDQLAAVLGAGGLFDPSYNPTWAAAPAPAPAPAPSDGVASVAGAMLAEPAANFAPAAAPAGSTYTPTAAEAANADTWLATIGYQRDTSRAWLNQEGGVFKVPVTTGDYITFGWGRGDFSAFPGPSGGVAGAPTVTTAPVKMIQPQYTPLDSIAAVTPSTGAQPIEVPQPQALGVAGEPVPTAAVQPVSTTPAAVAAVTAPSTAGSYWWLWLLVAALALLAVAKGKAKGGRSL